MSIPEVATVMQALLGPKATELATKTGFVQRASKVDGGVFARTLVFSWLDKPGASLQDLTQTAAATGVRVTSQGLNERFGPTAADFLRALLEEVVARVVRAEPVVHPLLGRFAGVYVQDSTVIPLPGSLEGVWLGCGGTNGSTAALKLHVRLDLSTGAGENGGRMELEQLLAGSHGDEVAVQVRLGSTARLPVRIVARRVPIEVRGQRLHRLRDKALQSEAYGGAQ